MSTALLALQGPRAQDVLQQALPDLNFTDLKPFDLIKTNISNFGQDKADKKHTEEKQKVERRSILNNKNQSFNTKIKNKKEKMN